MTFAMRLYFIISYSLCTYSQSHEWVDADWLATKCDKLVCNNYLNDTIRTICRDYLTPPGAIGVKHVHSGVSIGTPHDGLCLCAQHSYRYFYSESGVYKVLMSILTVDHILINLFFCYRESFGGVNLECYWLGIKENFNPWNFSSYLRFLFFFVPNLMNTKPSEKKSIFSNRKLNWLKICMKFLLYWTNDFKSHFCILRAVCTLYHIPFVTLYVVLGIGHYLYFDSCYRDDEAQHLLLLDWILMNSNA